VVDEDGVLGFVIGSEVVGGGVDGETVVGGCDVEEEEGAISQLTIDGLLQPDKWGSKWSPPGHSIKNDCPPEQT